MKKIAKNSLTDEVGTGDWQVTDGAADVWA
jgi:hypothetical protein